MSYIVSDQNAPTGGGSANVIVYVPVAAQPLAGAVGGTPGRRPPRSRGCPTARPARRAPGSASPRRGPRSSTVESRGCPGRGRRRCSRTGAGTRCQPLTALPPVAIDALSTRSLPAFSPSRSAEARTASAEAYGDASASSPSGRNRSWYSRSAPAGGNAAMATRMRSKNIRSSGTPSSGAGRPRSRAVGSSGRSVEALLQRRHPGQVVGPVAGVAPDDRDHLASRPGSPSRRAELRRPSAAARRGRRPRRCRWRAGRRTRCCWSRRRRTGARSSAPPVSGTRSRTGPPDRSRLAME